MFAGAAAAYSVRIPGGSTYIDPLLRVRRSSDNAEQDIGALAVADANGNRWLDTNALLAFVGSGSGFVTTWYDQSGNGRHAVQATAGNQPRIVNAGVVDTVNGIPQPFYTGTTWLTFAGTVARTVNAVARPDAAAVSLAALIAHPTGDSSVRRTITPANGWRAIGDSFFDFPTPATSWVNGATAAGTSDGGASVTHALATPAVLHFDRSVDFTWGQIGRNASYVPPSRSYTGHIGELVLFAGQLSATNRQALNRSQGAAFGITVA